MKSTWFMLILACFVGLSACETSSYGPIFLRCPINDIETARQIAAATIKANAGEYHELQLGYRIDLTDEGRFWSVHDGPNIVEDDSGRTLVYFGGASFEFKIAKCSGAVSEMRFSSWV